LLKRNNEKMKSYTEEVGGKLFDWNIELNRPENEIDWVELEVKAGLWVSCACGNQCSVIPRNHNGEPKDNLLRSLGMEFYDSVADCDVEKSKLILANIEIRSAFLINEIINK
jgi:hypothetical protein